MQTSQVPPHPNHPTRPTKTAQPAAVPPPLPGSEVAALRRQLDLREEELRDFIENGLECMHQVDAGGAILWVNQAELDFLGYTLEEYLGRNIREFHTDPALLDSIFDDLGNRRAVRNRRASLRAKDGSLRTVLINSNGVYDEQGRFVRSRCFSRSIDDLTQAELALQARERQSAALARLGEFALGGAPLQSIFERAVNDLAGLFGIDHAGLAEIVPGPAYRIVAGIGWRDGLVGKVLPLPSAPASQGHHTLQAQGPQVYEDLRTETRFQPAPILLEHGVVSGVTATIAVGERIWGTLAVHSREPARFREEDGRFVVSVAHVLASAIQRHAMEDTIRARERQQAAVARLGRLALAGGPLQDLFDAVMREICETVGVRHAGLCQLHPDGRFSFNAGLGWRPGVVGMTGMPASPRGQGAYMLASGGAVVSPDVATETRYEVSPLVLEAGIVSSMAVPVPGRDQPWGIMAIHSTTRRDFTPDEVTFADAVAHILAGAIERKATEDELEASRAHLEEVVAQRTSQLASSNRELEAFSYSVSHDLRAPLRTISGFTSLLTAKHARELSPPAIVLLDGVRKSADRLGRLIDDLLDLSRVQRVDFVRQPVDLSAMASQAIGELAANDPGRKVEWSVEPGLTAEGDARLIGVLLQNLLGNAWKFTRDSPAARIQVGRQDSGGDAVFYVRDNGAGFDMAYATKLFQPFQRLHHTSEFEGTGVGLATVQRIVERHGGRTWAEGRPGKGASFYFTLAGGT
ncbi:MAG TPA: GAF domain-containing protein [Candidatus Thermoplasmatota archaeon]|nr:GAF domain-containing protein [Candidatus Thermoplasmatota archaeon]